METRRYCLGVRPLAFFRREIIGKQYRHEGDSDYKDRHNIGNGANGGVPQLTINPDWQSGLLARGECGHDHFIKR